MFLGKFSSTFLGGGLVTKLHVHMVPSDGLMFHGVHVPTLHPVYQDWLQVHSNPTQDKPVTEDGWIDQA